MYSGLEICFITGNKHKIEEVKLIAEKYGVKIITCPIKKLEIQTNNLLEIAKIAAFNAYIQLNKPVLVEDAGLFIEVLNGFPGPYSSYVYRTIGCNGILRLMENMENRKAYFRSAAALIYEPYIITAETSVEGYIAYKPRGDKGFGFDPIFIPLNSNKTFAEMSIEEKNKYSHRAKTMEKIFSKLISYIKDQR
ncbi:MAG: non-canonical purine NTP pyrophosphatase, RdgB/HAM1 family [Desulfurococcales archaeon ex4484_58]|nr:MAG: non-canonical purine NTP pyrophosphatase, RdgB/HAM1 family [Desulfurococcales archaeon ex4484_58]